MNGIIVGILIVEILLTIFFFIMSFKKRLFLTKKNLFYFIPVVILNTVIFCTSAYYNESQLTLFAFLNAFENAIKAFAFQFKSSCVMPLYEEKILFKVISLYGFGLASICTFSTAIGLFKISIFNQIKIHKVCKKEHMDVVIGLTNDSLKYLNNYKNSILIVNLDEKKLSLEEKKNLFSNKIAFKNIKLNSNSLNNLLNKNKNNTNVVCFNTTNNFWVYFGLVENTKLNDPNKIVSFKIQADYKHQQLIDDQLSLRANKNTNVIASTFDSYQLIALEFSKKYNFAQFIDPNDFNKGALKKNVNINCYFLGFGNTNNAIFKSVLMNNQFVKEGDDGVQPYQTNYYIYEKDKEKLNVSYVRFLQKYDDFIKHSNMFEKPEKLCNLHIINENVYGEGMTDLIERIDESSSNYNFFIVGLNDSLENNEVSNQLFRQVKGNKIIFYKVRGSSEIILNNPKLLPFGFKKNVLNHNSVCCEDEYSFASKTNSIYQQINSSGIEFTKLNIIEKLSNIYQDMNVNFKLNCLGYQISTDAKKSISKEQFIKDIELDKVSKYEDYFASYTVNNLAKQEHFRWNTFYLLNGFTPMNLDCVYFNGTRVVHKDLSLKQHACLTTFVGLDTLHKYELDLYKANGITKTIDEVETYKYDIQLLSDLVSHLQEFNYYIVKKGSTND